MFERKWSLIKYFSFFYYSDGIFEEIVLSNEKRFAGRAEFAITLSFIANICLMIILVCYPPVGSGATAIRPKKGVFLDLKNIQCCYKSEFFICYWVNSVLLHKKIPALSHISPPINSRGDFSPPRKKSQKNKSFAVLL